MSIWTFKVLEHGASFDFVGFAVEAVDGPVGIVEAAAFAPGSSYVLVRTPTWRGDDRRALPAALVSRVDVHERRVWIESGRDRIHGAPTWTGRDPTFAAHGRAVAAHFGGPSARALSHASM